MPILSPNNRFTNQLPSQNPQMTKISSPPTRVGQKRPANSGQVPIYATSTKSAVTTNSNSLINKPPKSTSTAKTIDASTSKTLPKQKLTTKCPKKFGSFEFRKHKCNSPMFYSVRCRKHGKKRTVFELYTLPLKYKFTKSEPVSTQPTTDEVSNSNPVGDKPAAVAAVNDMKTNCVVISEIPKTPEKSASNDPEINDALYQNLTDSIQIMEQNSENNIYESIQNRPKPAPRCKKSPNNIYQNIAFLLKVTPERNQNERNAFKEDQSKKDSGKVVEVMGEVKIHQSQNDNLNIISNTSGVSSNTAKLPSSLPATENIDQHTKQQDAKSSSEIDTSSLVRNNSLTFSSNQDLNVTATSIPQKSSKCPSQTKHSSSSKQSHETLATNTDNTAKSSAANNTDSVGKLPVVNTVVQSPEVKLPIIASIPNEPKIDPEIKCPIPLKPTDCSNPALIPKMPILDTHNKWTTKPLVPKVCFILYYFIFSYLM